MKTTLIVGVMLVSLLAASCVVKTIEGSGDIETETRQVSGFDSIELSHMGDVYLTQGETEGLTVRADDNLLEYIVTEVVNGTLKLGVKREAAMAILRPTEPIVFEVDFRELSGLAVSGSGSFEASSLETEHLVMAISGSGDITIAGLVATELRTAISGSGKATLEGEARSQSIAVSGSGRYRARELLTSEGSVDVSGSGVVELNATDHLEVGISGSGTVRYLGEPTIDEDISGSGSLRRLDSSAL